MSFSPRQFLNYIVEPVLKELDMYSEGAAQLMLATCAVESEFGRYFKQIKGPALGIYQMEPKTFYDIFVNYLDYRKPLREKVIDVAFPKMNAIQYVPKADDIMYNIRLATVMTRIHYYRQPKKMPKANDVDAIWSYYKDYYNTHEGKATFSDFIGACKFHLDSVLEWGF